MTTLTITRKRDGSFQGDGGETIPYTWYKALTADELTIEFGSKDSSHEVGQTLELEIEKFERTGGRIGYKEITAS